jgi:hypothetical protein
VTKTENMSDAIAFCGAIYLLAAVLVLAARVISKNRPVSGARGTRNL